MKPVTKFLLTILALTLIALPAVAKGAYRPDDFCHRHEMSKWADVEKCRADCENGGMQMRVCKDPCCDYCETRKVDALGHDWDEGSVTAEATCRASGEKLFVCSRCTATRKEEIPANPDSHDPACLEEREAVAAACVTEGITAGTYCNGCGKYITGGEKTPVNPDNHAKPVLDAAAEPTCEQDGLTDGIHCEACGKIIKAQEKAKALGHDYDKGAVTKEATCTEKGEKTFTCQRDKTHVKTEEIAAKGHAFGKWKTLRQPTEQREGLQERTCKVCGAKESRALTKLNPGETVVPKTEDSNRYGLPGALMGAAALGLLLNALLKRRLIG